MPVKQLVRAICNRATHAIPVKLSHIRLNVPVASFTFDDFAKSAWTSGGPLIEAFGGRATYYVAGRLCGLTEDGVRLFDEEDLATLAAKGHDAGSHTFAHAAIPDLPARAIEETLRKNHEFVKGITGQQAMTSFAYPFGLTSVRTKLLLKHKFGACRGVYPGINAGWTDFSQLSGISLHLKNFPFEKYIEKALSRGGWLIFIGHDVSENPTPYGCTQKVLERVLKLVSAAGIEIQTVDTVLRRILGPKIEATSGY
jgi:peptidoglycan/xylan/chitin deacetylase (PgdA/CDA1 family)